MVSHLVASPYHQSLAPCTLHLASSASLSRAAHPLPVKPVNKNNQGATPRPCSPSRIFQVLVHGSSRGHRAELPQTHPRLPDCLVLQKARPHPRDNIHVLPGFPASVCITHKPHLLKVRSPIQSVHAARMHHVHACSYPLSGTAARHCSSTPASHAGPMHMAALPLPSCSITSALSPALTCSLVWRLTC